MTPKIERLIEADELDGVALAIRNVVQLGASSTWADITESQRDVWRTAARAAIVKFLRPNNDAKD